MEVYLDNSATTMCYPEVGELVYHIMCRDYGNPSAMYRKGMEAERYIKEAAYRRQRQMCIRDRNGS